MQYSKDSVVPTNPNAVPWFPAPPPTTVLVPSQDYYRMKNVSMGGGNRSSITARRCLFTLLFGLLIIALIAVAVVVPVVVAVADITTTTTTTTATTATTTSVTTTTATSSTTSTTTTISPFQWNTTGSTIAGQTSVTAATAVCFNLPIGIRVDSSNRLYVADGDNNRIQRFVIGNVTGTTIAGSSSGVSGSSASLLSYPNDVAVDSSGNLFIVEAYNHRVQFWPANATSGFTIAGNGTVGSSLVQLNSPRAIAFGANQSTFFVSDGNNSRILMYTLNSTMGTVVAGGNGAGTNNNQLNSPRGLYYDASTNSLVIANFGSNNVVRWVIGASNWTLVVGNANGVAGSTSTSLNGPWGVITDPFGNLYVADRYNDRIQFFAANSINGTTIAGVTGISGTSSITLNNPLSLALDSQYNLIVSDSFNYRMQEFARY